MAAIYEYELISTTVEKAFIVLTVNLLVLCPTLTNITAILCGKILLRTERIN